MRPGGGSASCRRGLAAPRRGEAGARAGPGPAGALARARARAAGWGGAPGMRGGPGLRGERRARGSGRLRERGAVPPGLGRPGEEPFGCCRVCVLLPRARHAPVLPSLAAGVCKWARHCA